MKKITKTNFQGLRQLFPVLEKEEMRHYIGGTFGGYYYTGGWNGDGGYYGSSGSSGSSYYSQYDFDNWEGPWYGGWVDKRCERRNKNFPFLLLSAKTSGSYAGKNQ